MQVTWSLSPSSSVAPNSIRDHYVSKGTITPTTTLVTAEMYNGVERIWSLEGEAFLSEVNGEIIT